MASFPALAIDSFLGDGEFGIKNLLNPIQTPVIRAWYLCPCIVSRMYLAVLITLGQLASRKADTQKVCGAGRVGDLTTCRRLWKFTSKNKVRQPRFARRLGILILRQERAYVVALEISFVLPDSDGFFNPTEYP